MTRRLLPINKAALDLSLSPDTVRRHIRLGLLHAEREPRGRGYRWLVEVPESALADPALAQPDSSGETLYGSQERQTSLRELVNDMRRTLAVVSAELEARREEVSRLLNLLEKSHII